MWQAGGIPPLVALLGGGSSVDAQAHAAGALSGLAHKNPDNQAAASLNYDKCCDHTNFI